MIHVHLIGGIVVSAITSSTVDRGFDPWLDQTKDYKIESKLVCDASPMSAQH